MKNQKQCGACSAFAAISAIETCMIKNNGGKSAGLDLSEQYLIDCGFNGKSMNGCNGATPEAFGSLLVNKLGGETPHEYYYPYLNTKPKLTCPAGLPIFHAGAKVTSNVYTYSCNDTYLKQLVYQYGAVVSTIYAGTSFNNYAGGIYRCTSS